MLPLFLCEVIMEEDNTDGTFQTSVTCTKYTNGQYGCAVVGKRISDEMIDDARDIGTAIQDSTTRKFHYVSDFIIFKRGSV